MDKFMIKGILNDNELDKLNSMEGIIDLLCDIPNFNMDMYEELDEEKRMLVDNILSINLLTDSQIDSNLRQSMDKNNLALINKKRLTALSLLYFGEKDDNNNYIRYICPYTGKPYNLSEIYYELRKPYSKRNKGKILELEHIRPQSSGGGTVLFNCIPSSKEANSRKEKSNLHLLDWYNQSGKKHYNKERLYNLVSYIISAYSISFREYHESDLDYYENDINNDLETDNDELENIKEEKEKIKNKKTMLIEDYIPFLKRLINKLEIDGYDVSVFNNKLIELENNGIVSNIAKYEMVQNALENLFKEYAGDENTSYLTYSINIDYTKLVNSINSEQKIEIESILRNRLLGIKNIMDINNKTMKDYFISLKDNQEIDIIYKDNPTKEEIDIFVNNVKLGKDSKINIFIEMLTDKQYTSYTINNKGQCVPDSNNIFNQSNKIPFKGYESLDGLNTACFWRSNKTDIKKRLSDLEKNAQTEDERKKYQIVRRAIDDYEFQCKDTGFTLRIDKFIEMLTDKQYTSYTINDKGQCAPDSNNIFGSLNKIPFKGYESLDGLNTAHFWSSNKTDIKKRLSYLEENAQTEDERKKYQIVRRAIDDYEFQCQDTGLTLRIDKFIEMLTDKQYTSYTINNKGQRVPDSNNIFKTLNKIPFKGYESIDGLNTALFWKNNSQKYIIPLLFYNKTFDSKNNKYIDSDKDYSGSEYDGVRRKILDYLKLKDNINEYVDKLNKKDKKTKQVQNLIDLRDSLKGKDIRLRQYREELLEENIDLRESINSTSRRAM